MTREQPSDAGVARFRRLMQLFEDARSLSTAQQADWLARECADATLRAEVERMLAEDRSSDGALAAGQGLRMFDERASTRGSVRGVEELEASSEPLRLLRGDYRVLGVLGEGGAGVVYEAEQAFPRRRVALKALRAGRASRRALARFAQEAHILGRLQHPGIAQLYEAGSTEGERGDQAYLVMELVQGSTLTEYARDHALERRQVVELLAQIADAVHHAHQRRVIHRDLKPANILVTPSGAPKILDFGIARLSEDEVELSRTSEGMLVGTAPYMSPEQVSGGELDARVDVYALGVLLYELLTGRLPHAASNGSLPELLIAIQSARPKSPSALDPSIPSDLGAVCLRALEKDREQRYASAAELASDLRLWSQGRPVRARGDAALYVLAKLVRRHRAVAALAALSLLAIAALAIQAVLAARRDARQSERLAIALHQANLERGRLLAASDDFARAEEVLWREHAARPDDGSWWALWDLYSTHPVAQSFAPRPAPVIALAQSPDARWLAAGAHDASLVAWDLRDGGEVELSSSSKSPPRALAFCGTSRAIVLDDARVATCYDVGAGRAVWSTPAERGWTELAAEPAGGCAALATSGGEVALLDAATGEELQRLPTVEGGVAGLAFSPDGAELAIGESGGHVRIVRRADPRDARRFELGAAAITALAWPARGPRLLAGDAEGQLYELEPVSGAVLRRTAGNCGSLRSIQLDRQARRALISGSERVGALELDGWKPLEIAPALHAPNSALALFADGIHCAAAGADERVRVWELETRSAASVLEVPKAADAIVALGLESRRLALALPNGGLETRRIEDGALVAACKTSSFYLSVSFDDRQTRVVAGGPAAGVDVFDAETGELVTHASTGGATISARFAPDGSRLAVATAEGVAVWNLERGALEHRLGEGCPEPARISFAPDGRELAIVHKGGRLTTWELASGARTGAVELGFAAGALRWLSGDRTLAIGGIDGRLALFEGASLDGARTLFEHGTPLTAISASSDGRWIAASSRDGVTRIFSRSSEEVVATLDPRAGTTANLSFDRAGETLWIYQREGTLVRWDLARGARCIAANARAFGADARDPYFR